MSDTGPRLVALREEPHDTPADEARAARNRGGRSPLLWVLAGALVLCALGWIYQVREARQLAASLEATRTALGQAQAELRAYDQHLARVGAQVGAIRDQLDSLQALVDEGPGGAQEP
jgi:type VI protein secretion system component VasK